MKKTALLLSFCALLAACDSGYKKDGPDEARANETTADGAKSESDSSTAANLSAVAQQPQIDTSVNKIGTEHPSGAVASTAVGNGQKLMAASDCGACHQEKTKVVGPAYTAVAQKYEATEANISMLATAPLGCSVPILFTLVSIWGC
jgi:cytochrome c